MPGIIIGKGLSNPLIRFYRLDSYRIFWIQMPLNRYSTNLFKHFVTLLKFKTKYNRTCLRLTAAENNRQHKDTFIQQEILKGRIGSWNSPI